MANKDNKKVDKNNNGIDDKTEQIMHYILVIIMLLITTPAFYNGLMKSSDFKWVLFMVVGLVVGFDVIKKFI